MGIDKIITIHPVIATLQPAPELKEPSYRTAKVGSSSLLRPANPSFQSVMNSQSKDTVHTSLRTSAGMWPILVKRFLRQNQLEGFLILSEYFELGPKQF